MLGFLFEIALPPGAALAALCILYCVVFLPLKLLTMWMTAHALSCGHIAAVLPRSGYPKLDAEGSWKEERCFSPIAQVPFRTPVGLVFFAISRELANKTPELSRSAAECELKLALIGGHTYDEAVRLPQSRDWLRSSLDGHDHRDCK